MLKLYSLAITIYGLAIRLVSPINKSAKLWLSERRNNNGRLSSWRVKNPGDIIWVHCASHGEYEQALPLIEKIRTQQPSCKVALTFFSPSGYLAVHKSAPVHWVGYIPLDTSTNARRFISALNPSQAIFVKNEWWWNMLTVLVAKRIPTHFISSTVRADHYFVKHRLKLIYRVLSRLNSFGTTDQSSIQLLRQAYPNISAYVSGDLRVDRVMQIAMESSDSWLEEVFAGSNSIIYGSVWPSDIPAIKLLVNKYPDFKHILFPHKLDAESLQSLKNALGGTAIESIKDVAANTVLYVEKMGLLSKAYRYGTAAYVGGGFGSGIHNVLEAAVYGMPIFVGPKYDKSIEAQALISLGSVIPIPEHSAEVSFPLLDSADYQVSIQKLNRKYFKFAQGATDMTYSHIFGESQKAQ